MANGQVGIRATALVVGYLGSVRQQAGEQRVGFNRVARPLSDKQDASRVSSALPRSETRRRAPICMGRAQTACDSSEFHAVYTENSATPDFRRHPTYPSGSRSVLSLSQLCRYEVRTHHPLLAL